MKIISDIRLYKSAESNTHSPLRLRVGYKTRQIICRKRNGSKLNIGVNAMTLEDFRIQHSTLIEHYQFIESHLESIYAIVSGKPFIDGLKDVEKHNIRQILQSIRRLEDNGASNGVFTDEEYRRIESILDRRNFWCHNCYYDLVFDKKTGGLKKAEDIQTILNDLRESESLREALFDKYLQLCKQSDFRL